MPAVIRTNVSWELEPIQRQMIVSRVKELPLGTEFTSAAAKISFYLKQGFDSK